MRYGKYNCKKLKGIQRHTVIFKHEDMCKYSFSYPYEYWEEKGVFSFKVFHNSNPDDDSVVKAVTNVPGQFTLTTRHDFNLTSMEIEGYRFDSKKEFTEYTKLVLNPDVTSIEMRPRFCLTQGALSARSSVFYEGDFKVSMQDGRTRYIDVKGIKTSVYKIKKKLVKHQYGVEIEEL